MQQSTAAPFGDYKSPSLGRLVNLGDAGQATVAEVTVVDPVGEVLDAAQTIRTAECILRMRNRQVLLLEEW